jgi:flagellum-specific peptidoglycan hydrolase FlgJ
MKRHEVKGMDWSKIKKASIISGICLAALLGAFILGTFNPNSYEIKKIQRAEDQRMVEMAKQFGLHEAEFKFDGPKTFIKAMHKCIDYLDWTLPIEERVPRNILIAMAIIESDHGTSRFAQEGNNLFGVRTWDLKKPHMKPLGIENPSFGLKKYKTKCQSVLDVIEIINRLPAYKPFRDVRKKAEYSTPDLKKMVQGLEAWSTSQQYTDIIFQKIQLLDRNK